jgi:flagellar basal-body rod protein FlgF
MADGIYVGMAGATARESELDSVADGLANVQTPGFKQSQPAFEAFWPQTPGASPAAAHPAAVGAGVDLRPGVVSTTGNPLDLRVVGSAFLGVIDASGALSYTRDGRLSVSPEGKLAISGGVVAGEDGQPIAVPPTSRPTVTPSGEVQIDGTPVGKVGLFALTGALERRGGARLGLGAGAQATPTTGQLRSGEIELGNSNALEATVHMVSAQRNFESSMQAIETYRRMGDTANQVGKVS